MQRIKVIKKGNAPSMENIQEPETSQEQLQYQSEPQVSQTYNDRLSKLLKTDGNENENKKVAELIWRTNIDIRFDTLLAFTRAL